MPLPVVTAILLGLAGLIVGQGLALISVRLPHEGDADPAGSAGFRQALSPRHLLFSLAAAGIGVWAALAGALNGHGWLFAVAGALLGWQLLLIAVIDAEHFWLPDRLTLPLIVSGLIATGLLAREIPTAQIAGVVLGFCLLWLLAWLYRTVRKRDGLGGGDPILFAGAGAWVGGTGLPSVMMWACATGLCVVLWRLLRRRSVRGEDRLPFGTFLALGAWLTWLYGRLGL
jgi:leader peptidase (prepilin peptidase)/N-methyltransferase